MVILKKRNLRSLPIPKRKKKVPLLDLTKIDFDYDKDVIPFIKHGVIIDTCVVKTLIDGFIAKRISKRRDEDLDFTMLDGFLDLIKLNNKWEKFLITPHILTEVLQHFTNDKYYEGRKYQEILNEIMPVLQRMRERNIEKDKILSYVNYSRPVIEMGDISIFVATDDSSNSNEKIAVLSADRLMIYEFVDNPLVLGINYKNIMINL